MERCSGGVEVGLVLREERLDANFGDETETYMRGRCRKWHNPIP